jgi:hypothetical protein
MESFRSPGVRSLASRQDRGRCPCRRCFGSLVLLLTGLRRGMGEQVTTMPDERLELLDELDELVRRISERLLLLYRSPRSGTYKGRQTRP